MKLSDMCLTFTIKHVCLLLLLLSNILTMILMHNISYPAVGNVCWLAIKLNASSQACIVSYQTLFSRNHLTYCSCSQHSLKRLDIVPLCMLSTYFKQICEYLNWKYSVMKTESPGERRSCPMTFQLPWPSHVTWRWFEITNACSSAAIWEFLLF